MNAVSTLTTQNFFFQGDIPRPFMVHTCLEKPVRWFKECTSNLDGMQKTIVQAALFFGVAGLSLTLIGIPIIYLAYREWYIIKEEEAKISEARENYLQRLTRLENIFGGRDALESLPEVPASSPYIRNRGQYRHLPYSMMRGRAPNGNNYLIFKIKPRHSQTVTMVEINNHRNFSISSFSPCIELSDLENLDFLEQVIQGRHPRIELVPQ
ncbi:MAG: hypothetical protein Tsb0015_16410 [Simkaniaceae bacterium]